MIDKTTIINAAQKFTEKGQIDKAIAEWEKLLTEKKDGNIHNTIGDLNLKKGAEKAAIESFIKAADIFNKDGFFPKAIAIYKKILNIIPNDVDALLALAKLNGDKGLIGNAVENYFKAAEIFQRSGATEKTLSVIEKILQLSPSDLNTRAKIAELYLRCGHRERSSNEYCEIAAAFLEKDNLDKALEYYKNAVDFDKENIRAYTGLSKLAEKTGDIDNAFDYLRKAMSLDPENRDTLLVYSRLCLQTGRTDDARNALIRLTGSDPSNAVAKRLLGTIYLNEGHAENAWKELLPCIEEAANEQKWEDALELLNSFRNTHPIPASERLVDIYRAKGDREALLNELATLAGYYEAQGSGEDALKSYKEILTLAPDNTMTANRVHELEQSLGIAPPVEIFPDEPPASEENMMDKMIATAHETPQETEKIEDYEDHYTSGLDYKQRGLYDEAITEFQTSAKDPGKKLLSLRMIALCHIEKGAFPHAITMFNKILESLSPEDGSYLRIKYELAETHMKNKDHNKALELYTEIHARDAEFKDSALKIDELKSMMQETEAGPKPRKNRVSYI